MQLRYLPSVLSDFLLVARPEIRASRRPEPDPQPVPMGKSPFREIALGLLDLMPYLPALVGSPSPPTFNLFTD